MDIDARIERLIQQQEDGNRRQIALDESIGELVAVGRRTDERLDLLPERHEAHQMTVELTIAESREWREKAGSLIVSLAETMTRLGKIVVNHEDRITRLEGGVD